MPRTDSPAPRFAPDTTTARPASRKGWSNTYSARLDEDRTSFVPSVPEARYRTRNRRDDGDPMPVDFFFDR